MLTNLEYNHYLVIAAVGKMFDRHIRIAGGHLHGIAIRIAAK